MATIGPRQTVEPPRSAPWRPGLVRAARAAQTFIETPVRAEDLTEADRQAGNTLDRWANGIAYRPELSFTRPDPESEGERIQGPGEWITCPTEDEADQSGKTVVPGDGTVEWDPYGLWDGDTCTTLSSEYEIAAARAGASLEKQTSHLLENVLWTGEVNGIDFTNDHPNTALASADAELPNGTTPVGLVTGLALIIEALADTIGGLQAMIHVPASLIPFLDFYGQVNRIESANYLYAGDHMIVTGTGYPGTSPTGTDGTVASGVMWIYATSFVEVRLSSVFPNSPESALYATVDRDINNITVIAERLALASWDRTAHIGVPICLPDPGPDCATSS